MIEEPTNHLIKDHQVRVFRIDKVIFLRVMKIIRKRMIDINFINI
jgi:hypothetical protein